MQEIKPLIDFRLLLKQDVENELPTSQTKKRRTPAKKRKASTSTIRSNQTKKRRTTSRAEDVRLNMNFVHSKSQECTKSELDLFSMPPTQVTSSKGHWIDHQPVSSVTDSGPITFLSPGTDYVDLSKTIFVVRAKVTKADGANLDADEKVGVVNNFLHSLFKQVDVYLKKKQVTQAMGTYSYRSYLETLLNYGPSANKSQLIAALFYKDTAGKMDVADPTLTAANANAGLKARYTFSKTSG